MLSKSTRLFFDSEGGAAEALLVVLEDARETDFSYSFGSLSVDQIVESGLVLFGEIDDVLAKLDAIPGITRYDD